MIKSSGFLILIFSSFFSIFCYSQSYHVRVGFIGNSITIGSGLSNPGVECYPAQLGLLLKEKYGDTCIITNYAVSGRTMLKKGDFPIWNEPDFARCLAYAPDICFIMLGTNDSKPYNWDDYGNEFYSDYKAMVDTFINRNPFTKLIVCRPPPAFAVVWDIRNPIIEGEIMPLIDSIAQTAGAEVVDFYHPLLDSVSLFPDKIHPNAKGAKVLAKIAFDKIVSSDIIHKIQTGNTFVTSLKSSVTGELRISDKATLSWTTINANKTLLNGEEVELSGSVLVNPTETTKYTLVATGALTSDSLTLEQKVYVPVLSKFTVSTSTRNMNLQDTAKLKMVYYDQKNKLITDSVFAVNWSLTEGSGHFVNPGENTIWFVGDSPGTAKLLCSFRNLTYSISISITGFPTGMELNSDNHGVNVYPNPFNKSFLINIPDEKSGKLTVKLYDTKGRLCRTEKIQVSESGARSIELNTSGLNAGMYLFNLEFSGVEYSGKILKE